jgi:N-acetylneuraminic acid mutarotase
MKKSRNMFMISTWVLCLVAGILGFDQIVAHSATWQAGPPLNAARDQFAGGVIDGKIYVFGGNRYPDGKNLKSTEMYNPALNSWMYKADNNDNSGNGVEELSGAVLNGRLYVFGGYGGGDPYGVFNFVEEYNPVTDTWISKSPMPTTRGAVAAVAYNNKIYLFGGVNNGVTYDVSDVVEAYDPAKDTWQTVTHMPMPIDGRAVAVVADKAYVIGGVYYDSHGQPKLVTNIFVYDFIADTWATGGFAPLPNPRVFGYSSAAPVVNGKIYLIGGITGTSKENIWLSDKVDIYDTVSNTWQAGASLPTPTENHLSAIVNDEMYVVGGNISDNNYGITAEVWKCNISSIDPSACTANLNASLQLHVPYLSYNNGAMTLSADFTYNPDPSYPTLIPFKLSNYAILNNPYFSCTASTLSDDLTIHIPDLLLLDGITHLWVDLEYSPVLSTDGNFYWVVTDYGAVDN